MSLPNCSCSIRSGCCLLRCSVRRCVCRVCPIQWRWWLRCGGSPVCLPADGCSSRPRCCPVGKCRCASAGRRSRNCPPFLYRDRCVFRPSWRSSRGKWNLCWPYFPCTSARHRHRCSVCPRLPPCPSILSSAKYVRLPSVRQGCRCCLQCFCTSPTCCSRSSPVWRRHRESHSRPTRPPRQCHQCRSRNYCGVCPGAVYPTCWWPKPVSVCRYVSATPACCLVRDNPRRDTVPRYR